MESENKKPPKKLQQSSSYLFQIFIGSYVNVVLKNVKGTSLKTNKVSNFIFAGYFLDEDAEYIYLGQEDNEIYAAIKKNEVSAVMLADEAEDMMNEIDVPENQEVQ